MAASEHRPALRSADSGCLLIADVSGYTSYLGATELEHAQDVLVDLLETVVHHLRRTFHIAQLEGDAVFAYALTGELDAAKLLDAVDQTYFGFRRRRSDVALATVCTCEACRRIPELDLKVVVHDGRFVRAAVAGSEQPTGTDVNVLHRLLKNTVRERLGLAAYALFTSACVDALGMDPSGLGLVEHREHYDDVGDVACYVEDLQARWQAEQEQRHVAVPRDDAQFELVRTFAVPAALLWDWLTSPQKRLLWQTDFSRIDETHARGRRGVGTTNHCAHGRGVIIEEILDWRPHRYFTLRIMLPMLGPCMFTFELDELADDRTELRVRGERLAGRRRMVWTLMQRSMMSGLQANMDRLEHALAEPGTAA
jgi:class 3 adenylate cyclase/uncharacterized protein YndB with AHSA1/START domain